MAKIHELIKTAVTAGSSLIKDLPAIPDGKTIVLKMFGGVDINNGDNKSSVYVLQWGTPGSFDIIRVLSLSGATQDLPMKRSLTGNGTKFLRVLCQNNSTADKDLVFWIEAEQG